MTNPRARPRIQLILILVSPAGPRKVVAAMTVYLAKHHTSATGPNGSLRPSGLRHSAMFWYCGINELYASRNE
jgi:hypothetical protein